ncbi:hypothetical protein HYPSUDRAFT_664231 [Hypholoma sublateritium FD-334 SS-4]|uniref:Pali-domain-containing protein n=1 Tax=Hypholoma sublateritium (strain FD-334 SS-4) TaxID=945553 RepID=A0A0D2P062_HYPSF|nr:hypothetical protein HYPSUDRAFT_664231 [Hypholoma sublateritium FD-334 SS-4]
MSRAFCIPGIVFLASLDIVRVKVATQSSNAALPAAINDLPLFTQLRLGVWTACQYNLKDDRICGPKHHGYEILIGNPLNANKFTTIKSSWTRGLAVHPVATGVTFIAFLMSFSTHITVTLAASFVSFLAALLTLIAFAIDIALLALVKHAINGIGIGAKTETAPGFWLTFVSLILLLLGGCTVCFGRRKERMSSSYTNYPMQTSGRGKFWAKVTGKA